ncbi:MAG: ABC transporter ATP-binding protein, partial [Bacteroidales bacterium]|nr:ABC transporter ATP-binding protein [Bacteroidales bacterium]
GDTISRFSNDIVEYEENIIKGIRQLVIALINVVLYFAMLLYINYKLTIFVLCLFPIIALVVSRITRHLRRNSVALQQKTSHLTSLIEETLSGLRIIKAFTAIEFTNSRFRSYNESYTRLRNKVYRRIDLASPVSDFMANCIVMTILLFGAFLVFNNDSGLSPELFITYIMLFVLLINPAKDIANSMSSIKKGRACEDRLVDYLNIKETVVEAENPIAFDGLKNAIEFDNVSFAYNGTDMVLDSINLTIEKGKTVALVGHSGSGKSTLLDLLSRFYNVSSGRILLDGTPIENYSIASLRNSLGVVSQETILFNDTVFNNISFGCPRADRDSVIQAAKIANAHDFIMQMPNGYDTVIGDGGDRLSGGQRQRLSIARAVLKNPDIVMLDEATSALDTENERLVQNAMTNMLKGRTAIVVAHRLSTVVSVDEIIVLDKGRIVERGTHKQLYANVGGVYHKLCTMQNFEN